MNWGDIADLTATVNGFTNQIGSVNWAALMGMAGDMATITNQIGAMNWNDITSLSTNVTGLVDFMGRVNWAAITNLSGDMARITNVLGDVRWSDVTQIASNLAAQGTMLTTVNTNVAAQAAALSGLTGVDWGAIAGLGPNVALITSRVGDIQWSELQTMAADVLNVRNTIDGMSWQDIVGIREDVSSLGSKLDNVDLTAGGAAQQMLTMFDERLGRTTDSSGATVFGRLSTIEQSLSAAGGSAAQAAKKAGSAKTEAAKASTSIQALRTQLEKGSLAGMQESMDNIRASVTRAEQSIQEIPKLIGPPTVFDQMRQTAKTIETFAKSVGFDYLLNLQEIPTGGTAPGTEGKEIAVLIGNIEEMKGSLEFMKKLVEEMRFEPVVEDSLIGAP
jgi:hypothetical protein